MQLANHRITIGGMTTRLEADPRAVKYPYPTNFQFEVLIKSHLDCWERHVGNLVDSRSGSRDLMTSDPILGVNDHYMYMYVLHKMFRQVKDHHITAEDVKNKFLRSKRTISRWYRSDKPRKSKMEAHVIRGMYLSTPPCIAIGHGPWPSEVSPLLRLLAKKQVSEVLGSIMTPVFEPRIICPGYDVHIGTRIRGIQPPLQLAARFSCYGYHRTASSQTRWINFTQSIYRVSYPKLFHRKNSIIS